MSPPRVAAWPERLAPADGRLGLVLLLDAGDRWSATLQRELDDDHELRALLWEMGRCTRLDTGRDRAWAATAQTVLAATVGEQGWPVLLICLPDDRPVGAVAYRPARGRGGLAQVLTGLLVAWQERPEALLADAEQVQELLVGLARPPARPLPAPRLCLERLEAEIMALADPLEGGFGPAPRRAWPAVLGFLADRCREGDAPPALVAQLRRSCDALIAGAWHDHLGGGFFRGVLETHASQALFEKRLRDNALLALLLLELPADRARPIDAEVALAALGWVLVELRRDDGWYAGGRAAESAGATGAPVAGAAYLWTEAAAAEHVGSAAAELFAKRFLADERSRSDGDWALPLPRGPQDEQSAERLPAICQRLLMARRERPQPERVGPVLLADQGLLLRALAVARDREPGGPWSEAGGDLARALHDASLGHALDGGGSASADALDRAWQLRGLLAWGGADPAQLAALADELWDGRDEAGRLALRGLPWPLVEVVDGPEDIAAAAVAVDAFRELGQPERAAALLEAHAPELAAAPLAVAGLAAAWQRLRVAPTTPLSS